MVMKVESQVVTHYEAVSTYGRGKCRYTILNIQTHFNGNDMKITNNINDYIHIIFESRRIPGRNKGEIRAPFLRQIK